MIAIQPKTWKRICRLVLACMAVLAIFSLPPVYWRVIGWVKGEAFFQGRPTSYWAARVKDSWEEIGFDYPRKRSWPVYLKGAVGLEVYNPGANAEVAKGDPDAIPVLCELAGDSDPRVVTSAASGLGKSSRGEDATALAKLIELLDHPNELVRMTSAEAISVYGPAGRPAVPGLTRLISDPSPAAKRAAEQTLQCINQDQTD